MNTIRGKRYVLLTGCFTLVSRDNVAAGPAIVEGKEVNSRLCLHVDLFVSLSYFSFCVYLLDICVAQHDVPHLG
jgi:hypothetical protein